MRVVRLAFITLAATIGLAWLTSLAFNTGVLVWSWTYYEDQVFNIDPLDHGGGVPTYGPMGQQCTFLTYAGTRGVFLVHPDDYDYLISQIEEGADVDTSIRHATIIPVENWDEECPLAHKFDER